MRSLVLSLLMGLCLAGCSGWQSDQRLFDSGDWAHVDLNGPYENQDQAGEKAGRATFRTRPDGMVEAISPDGEDRSLVGLVAIEGGSGEYFLMVDRSDPSHEGDQYLIAHLSYGKSLSLYLPDCRGTSPVEGMTKRSMIEPAVEDEAPGIGNSGEASDELPRETEDSLVCKFVSKEALMAAGLEAERFLSVDHVVEVRPLAAFSPVDEDEPN